MRGGVRTMVLYLILVVLYLNQIQNADALGSSRNVGEKLDRLRVLSKPSPGLKRKLMKGDKDDDKDKDKTDEDSGSPVSFTDNPVTASIIVLGTGLFGVFLLMKCLKPQNLNFKQLARPTIFNRTVFFNRHTTAPPKSGYSPGMFHQSVSTTSSQPYAGSYSSSHAGSYHNGSSVGSYHSSQSQGWR